MFCLFCFIGGFTLSNLAMQSIAKSTGRLQIVITLCAIFLLDDFHMYLHFSQHKRKFIIEQHKNFIIIITE